MNKQKKSDQTALLLNFGQGNFRGVAKQCFYYLTEAGQIGPKPNRPKVKSAPVKSAQSQIGPIFVVYYCQHAKLNSLNTIQQNI
jgi:hypothetical protein